MNNLKQFFTEALSLDDVNKEPQNEYVNIFLGRMQPPTLAHIKIIEDAFKKYHFPVVICVVKSKNADSPFPTKLIKEMISKATSVPFEILELKSGFIGDFISPLRDQGKEPAVLHAGTDRVKSYEGQINRYKELFNIDIKVAEIRRTDEDISASKVREAIKSGDEGTYQMMMHPKLHSYFNKLKRYLK